jgi:hypothetical protein
MTELSKFEKVRLRLYYTPGWDRARFDDWAAQRPEGAWTVFSNRLGEEVTDGCGGNNVAGHADMRGWAKENGWKVSKRACPGVRPLMNWIMPPSVAAEIHFKLMFG